MTTGCSSRSARAITTRRPGNVGHDGHEQRRRRISGACRSCVLDSTGQQAIVKIGSGNPRFHYGVSNNVTWQWPPVLRPARHAGRRQHLQPEQPAQLPVPAQRRRRPGRQAGFAEEDGRLLLARLQRQRDRRLVRRAGRLREAARAVGALSTCRERYMQRIPGHSRRRRVDLGRSAAT